jgi:hypothetical protein
MFYLNHYIFFEGAFEYGGISKLWGYVGTTAELICVQFCNFVQCHIFVSYLSCYRFINGVLNIRDTNTVSKKYSRLYTPINSFTFTVYNMG